MCCCVVLRLSADGSGDRGSQGSRYPQGYTRRRRRGAAAATCQRQRGGARHTASVGRLGIVDGPDDQPSVQAGAHDVIYPACSRQYIIPAHRSAPLLLPATLLPQYYIGHTPTYCTILVLYDQPALTSECVCCSVWACHVSACSTTAPTAQTTTRWSALASHPIPCSAPALCWTSRSIEQGQPPRRQSSVSACACLCGATSTTAAAPSGGCWPRAAGCFQHAEYFWSIPFRCAFI